MKMPVRRLYVGGLSHKVDRQEIGSKFSDYGTVCNVDLKEKTDVDGKVIVRFAYVNLEADSSQVEKCIRQLNGASWLGSQLKVEPAKESFLDRLKRERASQPPTQYSVPEEKLNKKEPSGSASIKSDVWKVEEKPSKKKKGLQSYEESRVKDSILEEVYSDTKIKKRSREKSSANDTDSSTTHSPKKKKKNYVEEEILSSFKNFSSVWADSDEDEPSKGPKEKKSRSHVTRENDSDFSSVDKQQKLSASLKASNVKLKVSMPDSVDNSGESDATVDDDDDPAPNFDDLRDEQRAQLDILAKLDGSSPSKPLPSEKTINRIRRYDPTRAESEQNKTKSATEKEIPSVEMPVKKDKFVQVAENLKFGQGSSNFSLLAQFSQQRAKEEESVKENDISTRPVPAPKSSTQTERKVKSRPFL